MHACRYQFLHDIGVQENYIGVLLRISTYIAYTPHVVLDELLVSHSVHQTIQPVQETLLKQKLHDMRLVTRGDIAAGDDQPVYH